MSETSNQVQEDEMVQSIINDGANALVVNPSTTFLQQLIMALSESDPQGHVRIAAEEDVLKTIRNEFIVAAKTSELVEDGIIEVVQTTENMSSGVMITDDMMSGLIDLESTLALTEQQELESEVEEAVEDVWRSSESFQLRTPSFETIHSTMSEDISEEVADEYQQVLDYVGSFEPESKFDEVAVALLVAARNNLLLYDISKWGEDSGLASKATFSRTKTHLESMGHIHTEKVPIDVGRPRLRLTLSDELEGISIEDTVTTIQQQMISA